MSRYHADFMSDYLGIPRDKIHVVPLGIHWRDYNGSRKPKTDPFTIGYLARIVPEKGLHLLSEAFRALSQGGTAFRCPARSCGVSGSGSEDLPEKGREADPGLGVESAVPLPRNLERYREGRVP